MGDPVEPAAVVPGAPRSAAPATPPPSPAPPAPAPPAPAPADSAPADEPVAPAPWSPSGPAPDLAPDGDERPPTVICDDVHVVYRVIGHTGAGSAAQAVRRMLRRQSGGTVFRKVHAVRGVSMVAREGEAIALIGRNGSGKSTLLRAIAGLLPPESGHVYTAGRPTLLGVNAALMRDLPGEDNILLGCMAMGMSREEALARRDWIVDFADLGDFIEYPMTTYSSGMAARLRFAIAASTSHEILMIDEALATGDAEFRRRSEERIMQLREEAGTVFLVSHSLGVVRLTCNRAIWLEKGQVVMDGEANEVVDAYEQKYDPEVEKQERKARRERRRRERLAAEEAAKRVAAEKRAAREAAAVGEGAPAGLPGEGAAAEASPATSAPEVGPATSAPEVGPATSAPEAGPATSAPEVGPPAAAPEPGPAASAPEPGPPAAPETGPPAR